MKRNPEVHAKEALPRPDKAVAQIDQLQESTGFSYYTDVQSEDLERS